MSAVSEPPRGRDFVRGFKAGQNHGYPLGFLAGRRYAEQCRLGEILLARTDEPVHRDTMRGMFNVVGTEAELRGLQAYLQRGLLPRVSEGPDPSPLLAMQIVNMIDHLLRDMAESRDQEAGR